MDSLERGIASCAVGLVLAAGLWFGLTAPSSAEPAMPRDPVATIVEAFADHDVVALGEGNHGNLPGHALRLQLLREASFLEKVDDIVVEFGNSRFQEVIDRYIAGEFVAPDELRKVWQDTAQANPVWDTPIYEEFFRAVREVNLAAAGSRRLRVVLGDVPFDWSTVRTLADYNRQPRRDDAAVADIVRREVLAKRRKALLVYGDLHLLRRPPLLEPQESGGEHTHFASPGRSLVEHLESGGARVFSIYTNSFLDLAVLQPDIAGWQPPRIALLAGTPLGKAPFGTFSPAPTLVNGQWMTHDTAHSPTMEQQFDALLFIGAPSSIRYAPPSPALCSDRRYLEMRFFRMNLVGMEMQVEQAKQYCRMVAGASGSAQ